MSLLNVHQLYLGKAFRRELTPAEALSQMAKAEQAIIDAAYPNGPIKYLDQFDPNEGVIFALVALVALTMVVILVIAAAFLYWNDSKIIRYSNLMFGLMILFGLFLTLGGLLPYGQQPPTTAACNVHLWFTVLGVFLTVCSLALKIWRVFLIYRSAVYQMAALNFSNVKLLGYLLVCMSLPVVLLSVWTAVDTNHPTYNAGQPTVREFTVTCSNNNMGIYMGILLGYLGCFGLVLSFLAFVSRRVTDVLSESRFLALIVYNGVVLGAVLLPLIFFLSDDPTVSIAIEIAGLLAWTWFILVVLFIWKIVLRNREIDLTSTLDASMPHHTSSSRS